MRRGTVDFDSRYSTQSQMNAVRSSRALVRELEGPCRLRAMKTTEQIAEGRGPQPSREAHHLVLINFAKRGPT
jgi:hypothetical protein